MANQFVLTAQIALQAPTNARQTLNQIQRQLQGVNVSVNLNSNPAQIKSLNQQLNSVNQNAKAASNSVSELGKTIGAAARRFGAISLATGTFLSLTRAIKGSIGDAIEFERQMIILSQTTEKSVRQLGDLYREVTRLSTGLGVSSDGLIKTSIVLAQAGLEARKTKGALEVLAKTQLAASFDDIQSTTEGAIAILAQFSREAASAGGDIKFLETSLEAINQVSKKYAVESSDLIAVIRRSGGAFEAAGGSLNELLALFTSVRATTRESAETISTGLRTIFTRIQRADTIAQLKELGITLQDLEGKFVGPFEAIKRISEGLASLDPRDIRFAQIVEELGGFRQIGKVIPLIKQFALAQDALNTAQSASGSLSRDAETAQLSLANKIVKVKEEFQALVREFTQSEGFQSVANGALEFARALIRIADAIEPLLPLIASLGAIQIGRGLASALGAFSGFTRKNSGGRIMGFATGGMVPGTGNGDTVPAMLSPGEFVIRKSSVKKIGAENLQRLNSGGIVDGIKNQDTVGALILKPAKDISSANVQVTNADIEAKAAKQKKNIDSKIFSNNVKSYNLARSGIKDDTFLDALNQGINKGLTEAISIASDRVSGLLGLPATSVDSEQTKKLANSINPGAKGTIFEEVVANISRNSGGEPFDNRNDPNAPFDFVGSIGKAKDLFENQVAATTKYKDAKASLEGAKPKDFLGKIANQIVKEEPISRIAQQQRVEQFNDLKGQFFSGKNELREFLVKKGLASQNSVKGQGLDDWLAKNNLNPIKTLTGAGGSKDAASYKFAKGGAAPSDTVPALLTPGEFVVKKSTAQKVGYGALDRMNKTGQVQGYANGGVVEMAKGGNPAKAKYKAQRSAERKQETLAKQGLLFTPEDQIDYTKLGGAQRQAPKNYLGRGGGKSELRAAGSIVPGAGQAAASPSLASAKLSTKAIIELGKRAEALGLDYQAGAVLEKKYLQQRKLGLSHEEAYQKAVEAATKNLKNRTKQEKTTEVKKQPVSINTEAIQKIAQSAQNFIYLASGAATLATQFSSLSDASKEALTQTIALGATLAGTIGTVADFGINIGRSLPASAKASIVKGLSSLAPLIMNPIGLAVGVAAAALGGFAVAIYYMQAKAKAVADGLNKQADAVAQSIEQGKGGNADKFVSLQVRAAQTLVDSYVTLGGSLDYIGITSSKARQAEINAVRNSSSSFIGLVKTIADTDKALNEIAADKGLTAQQKVTKSVQALETGDITSRGAGANLQELLTRRNIGKSAGSVTEADFKLETDKIAFKNIQAEFTKFYEEAQKRKSQLANLVQGAFEEAMAKTDYNKLATSDLNFDGVVDGFDAIIEQNKEFEASYKSARDQILKINQEEVAQLKAQGKIFEATMKESEGQRQIGNLEDSMKRQADANRKATASTLALEKAMASAYAMGVATRKATDYIYKLSEESKKFDEGLAGMNAAISGELFNVQIPEIPDMKNLSGFSEAITKLGDSLGPQGQEMASQLTGVAQLMQKAKLELSNINFAQIGDDAGGGARAAMKKAFGGGELEKMFGPTLGKEISEALSTEIQNAIELGSEGKGRITDTEFEKIADRLEPFIGDTKEFFTRYNTLLAQNVASYESYSNALNAQIKASIDGQQKLVDITNRGAERIEEARGRSGFVTSETKIARRTQSSEARLGAVGLGGIAGNVGALTQSLGFFDSQLKQNAKDLEKDKSSTLLKDRNRDLTNKVNELKTALEKLADQSENASDVMSDIAKERAKRDFGRDTLKSLITGDQEERMGVMRQFAGANMAMAQGTFQMMPAEDRKSSFALLEKLAELDTSGGYKVILDQLIANDATMMGISPEIVKATLTSTTREQQLLANLQAINTQERDAQLALNGLINTNQTALNEQLGKLNETIAKLPENIGKKLVEERQAATTKQEADKQFAANEAAKKQEQEMRMLPLRAAEEKLKKLQEQEAVAKKTSEAAKGQSEFDAAASIKAQNISNAENMTTSTAASMVGGIGQLYNTYKYFETSKAEQDAADALAAANRSAEIALEQEKKYKEITEQRIKTQNEIEELKARSATSTVPQSQATAGMATGGIVYASNGGAMKPKGTDTVPAMLTPGEFVVQKSSVDKYGVGMMDAINSGQYLAEGGSAGKNPYYDPDWLNKRFKEKNPNLLSYEDYIKQTINYEDKNSQVNRQLAIESKDKEIAARNEEFKQSQYKIAQIPYDKSLQAALEVKAPTNLLTRKVERPTIEPTMRRSMVTGVPAMRGTPEQSRERQKQLRNQAYGLPANYGQNVYNAMNQAAPAPSRGGGQDAAMNGFKDFGQQITEAAKMLSGMTMNHTVTVDGMLNMNSAEVAQAVKDSVGEFVVEKIKEILKQPSGFTAGGSAPR